MYSFRSLCLSIARCHPERYNIEVHVLRPPANGVTGRNLCVCVGSMVRHESNLDDYTFKLYKILRVL